MADIQIAVIDEKDTQIALAVPGIQGPAGAISSGGSANQVFYKVSGTNYDAGWTFIGNASVDAAAAIAGTKISPNFGSQATVTTGTNTAASFIPTSATIPSNGIYLPGANQVGVATNGTGRLFVDASGRVGINSTPSLWLLEVRQNSASSAGGEYPVIQVNNPNANGYAGVYLNDSTAQAGLETQRNTGHLGLQAGGAERLRITSAGLVGIGTSSPGSLLHVLTGASTGLTFQNTSSAGIKQYTDSTAANADYIINYYGGGASANGTALIIQQNGTPRFIVNSAGNVGIGTTNIGDVLDTAAGNYRGITIKCGTTAHRPTLSFLNTADSLAAYIQATGSSLAFGTMATDYGGHSEKVRIDSSGRLLVGTSSTFTNVYHATTTGIQAPLQVRTAGNNYNTGTTYLNYSATGFAPVITLGLSKDNTAGNNTVVANNDELGYLQFVGNDGTNFRTAAWITAQVDGAPGSADMPGRLVFSTTPAGSASPTERMRIKANGDVSIVTGNLIIGTAGKGIDFSADGQAAGMTSELLDDYEEGTWTPTQGAGLTVVGTFTSAGHYTKVGRQVTVQGYVQGSTTVAAAANAVLCAGLPFGVMDVAGSHFIGSASNTGLTALMNVWLNQSTFTAYSVTSMAATPGIYFTVSYFTA